MQFWKVRLLIRYTTKEKKGVCINRMPNTSETKGSEVVVDMLASKKLHHRDRTLEFKTLML